MKILVLWPPHIPYYWCDNYHYVYLGELSEFLGRDNEVEVFDGGCLDKTWSDFGAKICNEVYDIIIICCMIQNASSIPRVISLCKTISPQSKLIAYGSLPMLLPNLLKTYDFDAIVVGYDWESIISKLVGWLTNHNIKDHVPLGSMCKIKDGWIRSPSRYNLLPNTDWGIPNFDMLPVETYYQLSRRRQIFVSASRGCPFGCHFCEVPRVHGNRDRRRDLNQFFHFLTKNINRFDLLKIFSASFTYNNEYVQGFISYRNQLGLKFKWTCVTNISKLSPKLILQMANAGCIQIGIGVETLEEKCQSLIGKYVRESKLRQIVNTCVDCGVVAECFIMIGIPGETLAGIKRTILLLENIKAKMRITTYAPVSGLHENMNLTEIENYNRKQFIRIETRYPDDILQYVYIPDSYGAPVSYRNILGLMQVDDVI